ncbi:hypothetical protein [Arthrobacter sp. NicSoilB4]|uniref:hypothetical protein n=1 Tax=Arthrobacter sp. NicSoilB4 TaxID=2830997 RepID=UPI001CC746C3|nr:hypothetical protein [Arthrobacter sp. NicSoilB4]
MLAHSLKGQAFTDFQDLPAWRTLVPAVALEIRRHTGQDLVAVQTVLMIAEADLVVDTSRLTAREVVAHIAGAVHGELGVRADG